MRVGRVMGFGFEDHDDFMDFMFSHSFMHSFSLIHGVSNRSMTD